jgi:hypothetical protein
MSLITNANIITLRQITVLKCNIVLKEILQWDDWISGISFTRYNNECTVRDNNLIMRLRPCNNCRHNFIPPQTTKWPVVFQQGHKKLDMDEYNQKIWWHKTNNVHIYILSRGPTNKWHGIIGYLYKNKKNKCLLWTKSNLQNKCVPKTNEK